MRMFRAHHAAVHRYVMRRVEEPTVARVGSRTLVHLFPVATNCPLGPGRAANGQLVGAGSGGHRNTWG
jgi:hypothetical protein